MRKVVLPIKPNIGPPGFPRRIPGRPVKTSQCLHGKNSWLTPRLTLPLKRVTLHTGPPSSGYQHNDFSYRRFAAIYKELYEDGLIWYGG